MHVLDFITQNLVDHAIGLEKRLAFKVGRDDAHSVLRPTAPCQYEE